MAASPSIARTNAKDFSRARRWVAALAFLYGLLWLAGGAVDFGLSRYLPLHTAMEGVAIVVAMLGFGISWNAYAAARPGNIVCIGVVLFGVGLIDFGHALSYHGMPDLVTPSSPHKAIVFWLAARFLAALGLLVVALRPWQPLLAARQRYRLLAGVLGYVALVYGFELFLPECLPDFFIEGRGLTPLKIGLEYGLTALYGVAALIFLRHARRGADFNAVDLFAAAAVSALSELCFTLYASVSDLFNIAGHLYKIIGYGFIYRAVFVDSVRQPFEALNLALAREQRWAAEQHSFVRTLDLLDEAVLELDPEGRIVSANSGWWRLADVAPTEAPRLIDGVHSEERPLFQRCLRELLSGAREECQGRFRLRAARELWVDARFVAERDATGRILRVRGILRDITKPYAQEQRIAHMALHDALTDLPNRVLLEERLTAAIQAARRGHAHVAVCFIDLDHFKNVNDVYGHKLGDSLLQRFAQALAGCLCAGDVLARWGGDEFVAVLTDLPGVDQVRSKARALTESMRQSFEVDDLVLNMTFSMGVAIYPGDGDQIEMLLAHADRAMFHAKSQGRNHFQLYADLSPQGLGQRELLIQSRLAQAIREGRIETWFQPLMAAQGGLRLAGAEALARWHDQELGWIPPGSFVPMAEHLGLIGDLGRLVVRQALAQFQGWRAARPGLHLALNISKWQLFAPDFVNDLLADCARHGIPASAITLEVTESVALVEVESADARLRQLAEAGFTLSIDDFGTGYASLSQLHELPVGELKIDISFVRRLATPQGLRMVQLIVNLARALRLRTVAEGVGDANTAATLSELGVDLLQGFYFGPPCRAADFEALPLFATEKEAQRALGRY